MGDERVQTDISEPMEESQSSGADKIDMSLDEIIKLNKKEQQEKRAVIRARNKRAANKNNVLRKLTQTSQARRGLRRGALQYQGSFRSRGLNRARGVGRRGSLRGSGQSPLNRASASTVREELLGQSTVPQRGTFRGRGRGGLNRSEFSVSSQRTPQRGGRPFTLDRGFSATRGASKVERYQELRSQTPASSSGSTLTVSLPNASEPQVRPRRGGVLLRGRSSEVLGGSLPKGIQLRFNYKATTNQTGLSLNDRFSSLRFRGRGPRAERGNGLGRGQSRGRGEMRGRGRGRGEMRGRGRGRGEMRGRGRGQMRGRGAGRGMMRGGVTMTRGGRGRGRGGRVAGRGTRGARGAGGGGRMVILQ